MLELTTEAETVGIPVPAPDDYNGWADYWFYVIGVSVIPADGLNKRPLVDRKQYQNNPVSDEQHTEWREKGNTRMVLKLRVK